jgi:hypothetical protein
VTAPTTTVTPTGMVTTASKFFFGAAFAALVASWAYGIGTGGELIGVIFIGFKGTVGEIAGFTILQVAAGTLLALGAAASILRDADPEVQAAVARLEELPAAVAPTRISYWPVLGAFGAVSAAIGLVASPVLFVIGLIGVGFVVIEWMVSTWSERATGDPSVNRRIRNRLMYPIEIPVLAVVAIAVFVLSVSRILIAIPKGGGYVVFGLVPAVILLVGWLITARPNLNRNLVAAICVVGGLAVLAGGVITAATGPRTIEEHHEEEEGGEEGSIGVLVPHAGAAPSEIAVHRR